MKMTIASLKCYSQKFGLNNDYTCTCLKKLLQAIMHVQKAPSSNLDQDTNYPEVDLIIQVHVWIALPIRPQPSASKSFSVPYSLITLSFDTI
jgi:hypothetical protein